MQNVDYKNNRSLFRAVGDILRYDGLRMFYKGLIPISIGSSNLLSITDQMHYFRDNTQLHTFFAWPFMFCLGTLFVHPFFLIGIRT